jgi:hypothetical protein
MNQAEHREVVSVDSGSSWLKAFNGASDVTFEAVTHELPETAPPSDSEVRVDGKRYLVGAEALNWQGTPTHEPDRAAGFHGGRSQHVQICRALSRMGVEGSQEGLVISLPYARSREPRYLEAIQKRHRFVWQEPQGEHSVTFSHIRVVSQGVGALRLFERENPENNLEQALLVDIGSCTTDVVMVRRAGSPSRWVFVEELCGSWQNISTVEFFQDWKHRLDSLPGFAGYGWNYFSLMRRAMMGRLTWPHLGQQVDISPAFSGAVRAFSAALLDRMQSHCGRMLWHELDAVILTGGGAALVAQEPWDDSRVTMLDSWANARGQYYHTIEA